ncbi:substrate-binding domain-containing protein [Methylobacter luteus]|uniref:substrate-binding domain-containing protein n=1 Tax=Methylobacter luteus TaxID=415 RepID=UPI001E620ADD|nr:substrate-binding domain-containing protein [Methylobacter luteus]
MSFVLILSIFLLNQFASAAPPLIDQQQNIVVPVINRANQQNTISRNGLSAIFKMRLLRWNDGSAVTVFVLNDDDQLHRQFCKQILNVFPHQMRRNWNKLVFSGSGQAPILVESKEEMIEKIANTPGSVGYLNLKDLTNNIKQLVVK